MAVNAKPSPGEAAPEQVGASPDALEGTLTGYLQDGLKKHQAGDLEGAEICYREALELQPDHPKVLHFLGVIHHQRGENEKSVELIERAISINPDFGEAYSNLGAAYYALNDVNKAAASFRRATELIPQSAEAHSNLAATLNDQGNTKEAIREFEAAHRANPTQTRFIKRLGDLYLELDEHEKAAERFEHFLLLEPDNAEVHNNLGFAYERLLKHVSAAEQYVRAAELSPDTPEILNNAGALLNHLDRREEAESYFDRALAVAPDKWEHLAHLAGSYVNRNEPDKALPILSRLVDSSPEDAELHNAYAVALSMDGRTLEAIEIFEKAVELDRNYAEAYNNMGTNRMAIPDRAGAIEDFKKAIQVRPRYLDAHINLCQALAQESRYDESYFYARATVMLEGFHPKRFTNPNKVFRTLCDYDAIEEFGDVWEALEQNRISHYPASFMEMLAISDTDEKTRRLKEYHRQWGEELSRRSNANPLPPMGTRKIGAKIRLGFISSDLRKHSVATFVMPLFQSIDRDRFELYCYSPYEQENDHVQTEFKALADKFEIVRGQSDFDVARQIREDRVDILFDMNGFTRDSRLKVMAFKPAPIQIEWLGYPFTTGVSEIDYMLTDADTQPEDPDWLIEKPLLMPETWVAFGELDPHPISEKPPFERNDVFTFGTMNNPYKYTREMFASWAAVIQAVPDSRFLVVRPECASMAFCTNFAKEMQRGGIGPERLNFVNNRATPLSHLAFYEEMDLTLDTYPVTGGNTTCDALWMGVPVVSMCGPSLHQRLSASILKKIGLPELYTRSRDAFVDIAIALANDHGRLRELRHSLRPMMRASCFGDTERWTRNFETLMEELVEKHGLT